jgi:hypothetical protein
MEGFMATKKSDRFMRKNLTPCMKKLEAVVKEFRAALSAVQALPSAATVAERERAESNLCLASRSAYFDFYTWVVLHGKTDELAKDTISSLLTQSLAVMQLPTFKDSVAERYDDFRQVCDKVDGGESAASVSSVNAGA